MFATFLQHQWTGFWRSGNKTSTIASKVILGIFMLYLIGTCILVGFSMEELIEKFMPEKDIVTVFNGIILYYFALDLVTRIQIQKLPTIAIVPYLHLKIPKRKLVNFLHVSSVISAINIFPLLLFFPFCITTIGIEYGNYASWMYMFCLVALVLFNNFAALYFKRISAENLKMAIAGLLALAVVGGLEYFKVFSIAALSNNVFTFIAAYPATGFLFLVLPMGIFLVNDQYLMRNLYMEELRAGQVRKVSTDYPFLDRFGTAGELVAVEIKLILRNKKPKATVTKGLIFLFYGFIFYKQRLIETDQFGTMLFAAVFMTGNTIFIYGQFMFGWQGAEFDGLLANRVSFRDFFRAKFILLTISATILNILTSFYVFISWKILLMHFAVYLYNIGVSTIIVLYFATRNYKFIDIRNTARFNWQGINAATILISLPFLLSPFVVYIPFSLIGPYWGLAGLAIFGLAGLLSRSFWINFLLKEFNKRKYKIATGFRER